jgi:acetate kinase
MIAVRPLLTFRVDALFDDHIDGTQTLGNKVVAGELWLDMPVVITRDIIGQPQVTLTLRGIHKTARLARIQVTAAPAIMQLSQQ